MAPTRRSILALGGLAMMSWCAPSIAQAQFSKEQGERDVLVVIFLRGGMDGLNFLIPLQEDDYLRERPSLGFAPNETLRLNDQFGLHPNAAAIRKIFDEGQLALVPACGSQDGTRSHFEAMKAMETGRGSNRETARGGWISQYLLATGGAFHPLRALALADTLPDSLTGGTGATALRSVADFKLEGTAAERKALAKMYAKGDDTFSKAGRQTLLTLEELGKLNEAAYKPANGATYPDTEFGQSLRQTAMLIKAQIGLEVICIDRGGWDTHVVQGKTEGLFANNVLDVASGIAALRADLGAGMDRVTTVVQTEFGRRVAENAGLGTDHGRASVAMVMSPHVRGGIHGTWPGLSLKERDDNADLRVANDYRNVLGDVLTSRLKLADVGQVFAGHAYRPMGLFG